MTTNRAGRLSMFLLTLPLLAGFSVSAFAQDMKYRSVSRFRVKPDRAGDFTLNIKEYISVMKKANPDRSFSMWSAMTGPMEYILVSYHAKYAELDYLMANDPKMKDVSAQLAAIGSRINACVDASERYVDEILPDLSLPRPAEMPKMVRMIRSKVKPGQANAYMDLIKSTSLPAMKKAGAKVYTFTRMRYGRPTNEFSSVTEIANWASLDGTAPIVQALGEAGYQQYLAKVMALLDESEVNLYRHMPELSYAPSK